MPDQIQKEFPGQLSRQLEANGEQARKFFQENLQAQFQDTLKVLQSRKFNRLPQSLRRRFCDQIQFFVQRLLADR